MTREINIGLIGLGYIGKIHALAYQDIPYCYGNAPVKANLVAVLRSRLDTEQDVMRRAGFQVRTTQPDEFFAQKLDVVDICSPNNLHRGQAERALQAGMAVYCEKPLACTYADARAMAALADSTGVMTQVAYVMRYTPAIRQMKALIDAGELGEVLNFRGHLFHSSYLDRNRPMSWRLRRSESGGGAFMDLGAHLVDMAQYLLGGASSVRALTRTWIADRCTAAGNQEREEVSVDDWSLVALELKSGAVGVLEATRMAAGATDAVGFEVYGSEGSAIFRASQPELVEFHSLKRKQWLRGALDLPPVSGERPTDKIWTSAKYSQGYFMNHHMAAEYDLLLNVAEGRRSLCDFLSAASVQEVIEAAYRSAAQGGELVRLPL
jgi:predicted dehydrogenase